MSLKAKFLSARWSRLLGDRRGAVAAEFALILIPMTLLTLGTMNLSLMVYTASALHFAAEDAARCASIKTDICSNAATTATYAATRYKGPALDAAFVLVGAGCGSRVTGTATYNFITGMTTTPVALSATACYALR